MVPFGAGHLLSVVTVCKFHNFHITKTSHHKLYRCSISDISVVFILGFACVPKINQCVNTWQRSEHVQQDLLQIVFVWKASEGLFHVEQSGGAKTLVPEIKCYMMCVGEDGFSPV